MRLFGLHIHRCNYPWSEAPPWAVELREMVRLVLKLEFQQETEDMATKETLDRLTSDVKANTDAANAAKAALEGFVSTVADLTAKLQAAIEGGDEDAIKSAADAIEANNAALSAAIPAVAAAVPANT